MMLTGWIDAQFSLRINVQALSEDALLGTQMLIGYIFKLDIEANKVVITKKSQARFKTKKPR